MNWENLTAPEFADAVEKCKSVCVIPIGVLERHGSHLPLGTDVFCAREVANIAAEQSEAMVFPAYIFGQIPEATHESGTVAIGLDLMIALLENVCAEISRNGFKKILLFSGHGGNTFWKFFLAKMLERRRDYMCYYYFCAGDAKTQELCNEICRISGGWGEHAGGVETAVAMHLFGDLVKMDQALSEQQGVPHKEHAEHFRGSAVSTPVDWYAGHPTHIDGYHGKVTAADGKLIAETLAADLAAAIDKIKTDNISMEKLQEFYDRSFK